MKKVLVTGAQGFIGFHLCKKLLVQGYEVIGIDSAYSGKSTWPEDSNLVMKRIKEDRLDTLLKHMNFTFHNVSIGDHFIESLKGTLSVVNLAARAGIPFSRQKPLFYEMDNTYMFAKLLYNLKHANVENFVYASSSSVYGGNDTPTGCTEDMPLNPLNVYAATKMYNELQAKMYGELYGIPTTGLRFFTVYGKMGRIDMALFKWTKAILGNEPVLLNNSGDMLRDFTHVSDIVSGIILALEKPQKYKIYNLGRGESVRISDAVELIERFVGGVANIVNLPYPVGEVYQSLSNVDLARTELGFEPKINIEAGLLEYVKWYMRYFNVR